MARAVHLESCLAVVRVALLEDLSEQCNAN